jgi:hypothetical protein
MFFPFAEWWGFEVDGNNFEKLGFGQRWECGRWAAGLQISYSRVIPNRIATSSGANGH